MIDRGGRPRARLLGSLSVAACALLATAPAASPSMKRASAATRGFLVELSGRQTTMWKADGKPPHGGCATTRGSADWIVPTKGGGTFAFTYGGSGTASYVAFPGGGGAFSGGADVPASGSIVGTFAAYVASQGYLSPSGICEDQADWFRAGGDEIAPTGNCGPFTGHFRFGLRWDGGAARASGSLERTSRSIGSGCPFLESWPSISLGSKINPFNFFDAKLSLSKEELLSGKKISRSWSTTETDQPPDAYGLLRAVTQTSFQVTLQPVGADDLIAVAHASNAVRGGTVTLDGSGSRGKITSYRWSLARGAGCPAGTAFDRSVLTGVRVSFRALCSFRATLTVRDATRTSDPSTVTVALQARAWATPFPKPIQALLDTLLVNGHLTLGRNVCALDGLEGDQQSGHYLHRGGRNGPTDGFTLAHVTSGPFRGNWYVSKYTAQVYRAELVSKDFLPSGDLYAENQTRGLLADFQAFRNSVADHEALHSALVKAALLKSDPARRVEAMVGDDEEALSTKVNLALIGLEDALASGDSDAAVKAGMRAKWSRPATVAIRAGGNSGYVERTFPSLADLGDETS